MANSGYIKTKIVELAFALISLVVGAGITYFGINWLGVQLEIFYGVNTFSPMWILAVFLVPFIAGIAVSVVYGLGGKILSYLAPLPILFYSYYVIDPSTLPEGVTVLPIYFWFLLVILASEFSGLGGMVGEMVIKKTYGRRPKHMIHKRYQVGLRDRLKSSEQGTTGS